MKTFTLGQAAAACGGILRNAEAETPVLSVVIDNRKATPGSLFVAIRGERLDGHRFIEKAYEAGAVCALTDHAVAGPHIEVKDTLLGFQDIAAFYRSTLPGLKILGITGSVGKTTTKEMLATVLQEGFRVYRSEGNLNGQSGLPQCVLSMTEEHELAVIEMGTNHFGEITRLARIVRPHFCFYTNIGDAHIENFGTREGTLRAKSEMLPYMSPDGKVFVNGDDPLLLKLAEKTGALTFGLSQHCQVRGHSIEEKGLLGTDFVLTTDELSFPVHVPAPGLHMVRNALAAAAAGLELGLRPEQITRGIAGYQALPGRMRIEKAGSLTLLNDAYNANPDSTRASLGVLKTAPGRKVAILGDMLELGPDSARFHEEIGSWAKECSDLLLCVGEESAVMPGVHFRNREELLAALPEYIQPGDTVLIKASHSIGLDAAVPALHQLFDTGEPQA